MNNLKKQKIDKIFLKIICILIIVSGLFIGSPLNNNYIILSTALNFISFIYVCVNFVVSPKKGLLDNFLCVVILLLTISSCIPVIFKKCISLSDSINTIFMYISLIAGFFMVKEIDNSNKKKYISCAIIISAIIVCVIGFDDLTFRVFNNILLKLGNPDFTNADKRMIANFGYANAFALYILIAFLLAFNEYKNCNSGRKQTVYFGVMIFFMICILLSYSRGTWICLFIGVIANVIFSKNKKINHVINIFIIFAISLIFVATYNKLYDSKQYILIYLYLIVTLVISGLLQNILKIIEKKQIVVKNYYKCAIIAMIIFFSGIGVFCVLLQFTQPLVLFTSIYDNDEYSQDINYHTSDEYLDIKINLESNSNLKQDYAYQILIEEKNEYNVAIEEHSLFLNNEKGIQEVSFKKQDDTKYLTITYKSLHESERRGLTINSITINDEDIVVDYKYLPIKIVDKIKNMKMNNQSIWERFSLVSDGIKIIKENWIIGFGGNAWEYIQYNVQQYRYFAKEVHSHPIELWMEFGIIGFVSYLCIVFYVVKSLGNTEKREYAIILAIVILHSCLDFDMSFYIVKMVFFSLLACISTKKDMKVYHIYWSKYIVLMVVFIGLVFNTLNLLSEIMYKVNVCEQENKISEAQKCIKVYFWNCKARKYIIQNDVGETQIKEIQWWLENEKNRDVNFLLSSLAKNIDSESDIDYESKKNTKEMELIYQILEKNEEKEIYYVERNFERYLILNGILEKVDKWEKEKLMVIINKEKNNLKTIIQDKNARLSKEEIEYYLEVIN